MWEKGIRELDFFTGRKGEACICLDIAMDHMCRLKNKTLRIVDFNEDFSAFHGHTLVEQAEYLNDAVQYILAQYRTAWPSRSASQPDPASVIVIGHSMGGIVARKMMLLPNYRSNSINTIVTLSTPHLVPPVTLDPKIDEIYNEVNDFWTKSFSSNHDHPLSEVVLISLSGGVSDTTICSDSTAISSIVPPSHGFTVFTTSVPGVWSAIDHLKILWCDQLREVLASALLEIVDSNSHTQTVPRARRTAIFEKYLLSGLERSMVAETIPGELEAHSLRQRSDIDASAYLRKLDQRTALIKIPPSSYTPRARR